MAQGSNDDEFWTWWRRIRAVTLFGLGVGLAIFEALHPPPEPAIVVLAGGCLGLELMWRGAETRRNGKP